MWLFFSVWVIIIIISLILGHPKIKGLIGERIVRKQLQRLPAEDYKTLNDVLIKGREGTSQIDHLVISPYGIFVIETKNYRGWIYGGENSEYWSQAIYRSKTKFRNPIKQNWAHICALKENLPGYKDVPYYPVIVFVGKVKLKNLDITTDVIYSDELFDTITKHGGPRKLSIGEIEKIFTTLKEASIKDKQKERDHISRIKWNVKIREMKEEGHICPQCGGKLVKRVGRYGEFYGCTNYPQCKYKMELEVA